VLDNVVTEHIAESLLTREDKLSTVREMTSWKWSLCRSFKKNGSLLSYLARLSRGPLDWSSVSFIEHNVHKRFGSRLTRDPLADEKKLYFLPRPTRVKTRPFFRNIERLPTYQEVTGDALEGGPTFDQYALHRARLAGDKWALKQHML
jgi:hypothetical protein